MQFLKQSTAATISFGPFVDDTDGVTPETGLTISQADTRLFKVGDSGFAQKNEAASATHDENGWYTVTLDTTDTNTAGRLRVAVNESGALPVWQDYTVLPANIYESWFGSDKQQVDIVQVGGTSQTSVADFKADVSGLSSQSSVDTVDANVDAILADTGTDGVAISTAQVNTIRDAVTDDVVEAQGSITLQEALSVILAVLAGRTNTNGTVFNTPNNSATRVTATVDASDNRTAITLNPSA